MRILPFCLYAPGDIPFAEQGSALTHAHEISKTACGIYTAVLRALLRERTKDSVYTGLRQAEEYYCGSHGWSHYQPLFSIAERERDMIRSDGFVVSTLEAALWCLLTTDSYRECVLRAVNLGSDTDTVGAVAGSLAGALYGPESIPAEWLDMLLRREYIEELCERAAARWVRD